MQISMNGRAAIVTGGSMGIGFAIAKSFTAAVVELKKTAKGRIVGVAGDVGTAAGTQAAYDGAMAAFGRVDILVNNAGTSATGPFEKLTDQILQEDLDLKLFAAVRLARLVW